MMFHRKFLNRMICVASTVALLGAVLTSPIRPPSSLGANYYSHYFRRNLALPRRPTSHLGLNPVKTIQGPIKVVFSVEAEEKLEKPASPVLFQFEPPPPFSFRAPDRDQSPPAFATSTRPLRC